MLSAAPEGLCKYFTSLRLTDHSLLKESVRNWQRGVWETFTKQTLCLQHVKQILFKVCLMCVVLFNENTALNYWSSPVMVKIPLWVTNMSVKHFCEHITALWDLTIHPWHSHQMGCNTSQSVERASPTLGGNLSLNLKMSSRWMQPRCDSEEKKNLTLWVLHSTWFNTLAVDMMLFIGTLNGARHTFSPR